MAPSKKSVPRARARKVADKHAPPPEGAQLAVAEPVVAEPVVAEPVVAEPVVAEPVVAEPLVAEPLVAKAVVVVAAPAAPPATSSLLQLGSSLSIREVSDVAEKIKAMLSNGQAEIDFSQLETIDTAGIQLLLVAAATAQRRGFKLKLSGSAALGLKSGAVSSLGLQEHLCELAEVLA